MQEDPNEPNEPAYPRNDEDPPERDFRDRPKHPVPVDPKPLEWRKEVEWEEGAKERDQRD